MTIAKFATKEKLELCPTGKRGHDDWDSAIGAALHSATKYGKRVRPYACNLCPQWHVSTQASRASVYP